MRHPNKILIKISLSIISFALVIFPFRNASAQIPVTDVAVFGAIAGYPGSTQLTLASVKATLSTTCRSAVAAFDSAQVVSTVLDTTSSAAFGLIGGSSIEANKLTIKLEKAQVAKGCVDFYITVLSKTPAPTVNLSQELQREQDRYTKISASLQTVITDLSAQQSASVKDILKAFMVKVLLNLNQNLTTGLVNKMVEKFKISSYLEYGNALASQVYSMKYIDENYSGDARQQMMIRSILQSPKFPEQIKTAQAYATSKAQQYIGTACGTIDPNYTGSNPSDFIKCLSSLGNEKANPQFQFLEAYEQAQQADGAGKAAAAAEISQSNGYAPPRDCSGSIAQQSQNDATYAQAAQDVNNAAAVSARLASALREGKTTTEELNKANAALSGAQKKLDAIPNTVPKPIIDVCKAIDSPASFVANSIGDFLKNQLEQSTQLKSDNLPFYANFLSNVASNFLTNILTGGKKTSQVLKEAGIGALNGAIIGVASTSGSGGSTSTPGTITSPAGDVSIGARDSTGEISTSLVAGQSYSLVINFSDLLSSNRDPIFKPVRVTVNGLSGGAYSANLTSAQLQSGTLVLQGLDNITQNFSLTVQFYGPNISDSPSGTPLGTNGGWTQAFTVSRVNGVSTVLPRGAMISPRGN